MSGRAERRRPQIFVCANNRVRDAIDDDLAIRYGSGGTVSHVRGRSRVRVRGRNEHPFRRNPAAPRCQELRFVRGFTGNPEIIHDYHCERERAVVENQSASVQRIVRLLGHVRREPTRHIHGELLGANIHGRGSSTKYGCVFRGSVRSECGERHE